VTEKVSKPVQFAVYSATGALIALQSAVFALYHPIHLLFALCGALILVGGVLSVAKPHAARLVAAVGIVGLLPLAYELVISLVPEHAKIFTPFEAIVVLCYVGLLAFACFFPCANRFSAPAFLLVLVLLSATYAVTYRTRVSSGEYDRPSLECYRWEPEPADDLVVARSFEDHTEDAELVALLQRAGVRGSVVGTGRGDFSATGNRLIVLARSRPPPDSKLFLPRSGSLLYAFDGSHWHKFPADAPTYPLYASFKDDRNQSMICRTRPDGGEVCFAGLSWR